ncbi:MAG: vitamin K epoxide reductase family protein [Actinobacteria bacterium]|nr:vitamin K epoxide reductase family protein [Actinomycetota bacterium]
MQSTQSQTSLRLDRTTAIIMIIGGALGLLAAVELTIEKIRVLSDSTYVPTCDINPVLSCGSVIITPQAAAFGFPNPILGIIGFSVVITLAVTLITGAILPRWIWLGLNTGALLGFAFVQWLVWQSLYSIGALCPWCMVVWTVTAPIAIWVTAANLASGRIPSPESWQENLEAIAGLRVFVLAAWYITVLGLIFVRWQDFWTSSM